MKLTQNIYRFFFALWLIFNRIVRQIFAFVKGIVFVVHRSCLQLVLANLKNKTDFNNLTKLVKQRFELVIDRNLNLNRNRKYRNFGLSEPKPKPKVRAYRNRNCANLPVVVRIAIIPSPH